MAITEDASTPAIATGTGTGNLATASFTPPTGMLLIALVAAGWGSGAAPGITLSDSVAGSWTTGPTAISAAGTSRGRVSIFYRYLSAAPGSMTVTAAFTTLSGGRFLALRVLAGAASSQAGAGTATKDITPGTTVYTQAITTTQTGSQVYMVCDDPVTNGSLTAAAASTLVGAAFQNSTDVVSSAAGKATSATGTPGATTLGFTNGTADQGVIALQEVLFVTAVTNAGGAAYASANTATITTASFTPASNSLLVATCAMGNGTGGASSLGTVTDSLTGTWTRLAGDNISGEGVAEVWCCDIGTAAAMTVTYDPGGAGASGLSLSVRSYTGARPTASQSGATATNSTGTAQAVSITTTTTNSLVVGAYGRATSAITLTANANTTIAGQVNGSAGDTSSDFTASANTGTPGATSYGFTNTAGGANSIALVEILPYVAAGPAPVGETVQPYRNAVQRAAFY